MSAEDRLRDILRYGQIAVSLAYAQRRDDIWRLALERSLFLIGEAASALPREIRQAIDQPWPAIIGLRNLLAHAYPDIEQDLLVQTAQEHVPRLAEDVERWLREV